MSSPSPFPLGRTTVDSGLSNSGELPSFPARESVRARFHFPPSRDRAQEDCARCTCDLVCNCALGMRTRAQVQAEHPGLPGQWLYGLFALSRRRLCHRRLREASLLSDLMPAPRHQDHTTSPYARATHVSRSSRVHRIPPRVRDDRDRPSHRVRRAKICG